jgi:hypothetical protein
MARRRSISQLADVSLASSGTIGGCSVQRARNLSASRGPMSQSFAGRSQVNRLVTRLLINPVSNWDRLAIEISCLTSRQAIDGPQEGMVTNFFVRFKSLQIALIAMPTHPFWFGRKIPFVLIEIINHARSDFGLPQLCPIFRCMFVMAVSPQCTGALWSGTSG